jgi:hypothetical protein
MSNKIIESLQNIKKMFVGAERSLFQVVHLPSGDSMLLETL